MKILIAVVGCEARKDRMQAQRVTWAKDFKDEADVRFFLGRQEPEPLPDEVFLDVDDGYQGLPAKVREVNRWALREGYERMLKTDDDSLVFVRKFQVPKDGVHYSGWVHRPIQENWCSGLAYWLDREAMTVIADAPLETTALPHIGNGEDRWTGHSLKEAGIQVVNDPGILFINKNCRPLPRDVYVRLRPGYVVGEFSAGEMAFIHAGCS